MSRLATIALCIAAAGALALVLLLLWLFDPRLPAGLAARDFTGSGTLSREEAGPLLRRDFDAIDRDSSGDLDGRELRRYILVDALSSRGRALNVPPLPTDRDAAALRSWLAGPVEQGRLRGAGMLLLRNGEIVFEHTVGEFDPDAPHPLGTASTWPAALTLGCLAERGLMDLALPLERLHEDLPAGWGRMRAQEMLAHVAGAPAVTAADFSQDTGLETAARAIMARYPPELPGREMRFGTVGYQVLGWLAEARSERSWRRMFIECLGWPMSLDSAGWGHPVTGPRSEGFLSPGLGLYLSMADYGRILAMLQQSGRFHGVAILSPETLAELERDRVGELPRVDLPHGVANDWGHAAGAWCERRDADGACRRLLSPGSYGSLAWLDRDSGLAGVVVTLDSTVRVWDWLLATRAVAEQTRLD